MINGESAINIYLYNIYTIYFFDSLCKYSYCAVYMQFISNLVLLPHHERYLKKN